MCVAIVKCDAHFHLLTVVPSLSVQIINHPFGELNHGLTFLRSNINEVSLNVEQFQRAQASLRYVARDAFTAMPVICPRPPGWGLIIELLNMPQGAFL